MKPTFQFLKTITYTTSILLLNFLLWNCEKDEQTFDFFDVRTIDSDIDDTNNTITLSGEIVTERYSPEEIDSRISLGFIVNDGVNEIQYPANRESDGGVFKAVIPDLDFCIEYTYQAVATEARREVKGEELTIETGVSLSAPIVDTLDNDMIVVSGSVFGLEKGELTFEQHGFWVSPENPIDPDATETIKVELGRINDDKGFSGTIDGLKLNTTYYLASFVENNSASDASFCDSGVGTFATKDGWLSTSLINIKMHGGFAAPLGDHIYYGFGGSTFRADDLNDDFERINIETKEVEVLTNQYMLRPSRRIKAISFTIDTVIYYGLGRDNRGNQDLNDLWSFTPGPGKGWRQLVNDIIPPRDSASPEGGFPNPLVFVLGDSAIIVDEKVAYSFRPSNPEGAKWRRIESFADQSGSGIKHILEGGVAFSLNNVGYLGLGQYLTGHKPYFFRYKDEKWEELVEHPFPGPPREFATAFVLRGYAYVGLGENLNGDVFYDDFYRFNEVEGWKKVSRLPVDVGRSRTPAAVTENDRAFIFGGRSETRLADNVYKDIFEYIPIKE